MKKYIIKLFGLKGSWQWAVKQMQQGRIVRCKAWAGAVKYRVDNKENGLLLNDFSRTWENVKWETSNFHISLMNRTDWQIFDWEDFKQ